MDIIKGYVLITDFSNGISSLSNVESLRLYHQIIRNTKIYNIASSDSITQEIIEAIVIAIGRVIVLNMPIYKEKNTIDNTLATMAYKKLNKMHIESALKKIKNHHHTIRDLPSYAAVVLYYETKNKDEDSCSPITNQQN